MKVKQRTLLEAFCCICEQQTRSSHLKFPKNTSGPVRSDDFALRFWRGEQSHDRSSRPERAHPLHLPTVSLPCAIAPGSVLSVPVEAYWSWSHQVCSLARQRCAGARGSCLTSSASNSVWQYWQNRRLRRERPLLVVESRSGRTSTRRDRQAGGQTLELFVVSAQQWTTNRFTFSLKPFVDLTKTINHYSLFGLRLSTHSSLNPHCCCSCLQTALSNFVLFWSWRNSNRQHIKDKVH